MLGNYSLRLCTMLFNKPDPVIYLRLSISRFAMAYSITCHADARARMPAINRGTCSCMHTMPFRLLDARSYRETRTDLASLHNDFVFSIFFLSPPSPLPFPFLKIWSPSIDQTRYEFPFEHLQRVDEKFDLRTLELITSEKRDRYGCHWIRRLYHAASFIGPSISKKPRIIGSITKVGGENASKTRWKKGHCRSISSYVIETTI